MQVANLSQQHCYDVMTRRGMQRGILCAYSLLKLCLSQLMIHQTAALPVTTLNPPALRVHPSYSWLARVGSKSGVTLCALDLCPHLCQIWQVAKYLVQVGCWQTGGAQVKVLQGGV